jgi:dienelactone hydrolase
MSYDPFTRGPHTVGVRTLDAVDAARDRALPIEVWYPADECHAGQDLDPATRDAYELVPGLPAPHQDAVRDATPAPGRYPFVAFSHGFGGHRRQSTFLCTHLASHGYVVGAVDHTGNTLLDLLQVMLGARSGARLADTGELLTEFVAKRPADADFLIAGVVDDGTSDLAARIDAGRIGIAGHSFGGWTALTTTARNRRVGAVVALAPAGGAGSLGEEFLRDALDLGWGRDVPALFLVADRDALLPLPSQRDILARTRGAKRMVALSNSDHLHFCDRIEEVHEMFRMMPPPGEFARVAKNVAPIGELCPPDQAYAFVRALTLAHFDAALKASEAAAELLAHSLVETLAARGIAAQVVTP